MAIVDAKYKFTTVEIGAPGRNGDSGVWLRSPLKKLINSTQYFPFEKKNLPSSQLQGNHFIAADEAFGLSWNLLTPYPGRNKGHLPPLDNLFNYRLSRGRRVVENAFGIAAARWRIWRKPIDCEVDLARKITKAIVVLHNFCMDEVSR